MLPEALHLKIESGLNSEIQSQKQVYGGDINHAAKLILDNEDSVFVKWNENAPGDMFLKEAKGLELLSSAESGLQIPDVKDASEDFLILQWIDEGGGKQNSAYDFGIGLARLHKKTSNYFGLDYNNFIGRLPQSNTNHATWPDFFALERIEPQIKMGVESNKLTRSVLKDVETLYKKLGSIFPSEKPALLHGDLWSGNFLFTKTGASCIYDPAVYYGHREMDIAMTRLFGGFSANFYKGYNDEFPLEVGFENRITLCNLYPILVHANLFGGSYCRQAENIIQSYV